MGSDPFPLTPEDANTLMNLIGNDALQNIPQWGSVVTWGSRTVLIFPKVNGTFAWTDISGGIPNVNVPGGYIPADVLKQDTPTVQTNSWLVGLYSLPSNFVDVAIERFNQAIAAGKYVMNSAGQIVASGVGPLVGPIGDIADSLSGLVIPVAVIGVVVLYFMYGKKK